MPSPVREFQDLSRGTSSGLLGLPTAALPAEDVDRPLAVAPAELAFDHRLFFVVAAAVGPEKVLALVDATIRLATHRNPSGVLTVSRRAPSAPLSRAPVSNVRLLTRVPSVHML